MNLSAPDRFFFFSLSFFLLSGFRLSLFQNRTTAGVERRIRPCPYKEQKKDCFEDDKELFCRGRRGIAAVNLDAVHGSLDREKESLRDGFALRCGLGAPWKSSLAGEKT